VTLLIYRGPYFLLYGRRGGEREREVLDRLGLQVKVFEKGLIKLGFINMFDAWLRATSVFLAWV